MDIKMRIGNISKSRFPPKVKKNLEIQIGP